MATYPVLAPRPKNWFERHWIMVGLGAASIFVCVVVVFVVGVFWSIGNSDAAKMAVEQARKSRGVVEQVGTPLHRGFFITGNIKLQGDGTGHAELSIPVSGPKGSGTVYLVADRRAGVWTFRSLSAIVGDKTVDLLEEQSNQVQTGTF